MVMMDQDPPIDPSVETAPRREPALPVSTMTGQVTNTPQLGPANPGVIQETTPVSFPIGLSQYLSLFDYSQLLLHQTFDSSEHSFLFDLVFAAC